MSSKSKAEKAQEAAGAAPGDDDLELANDNSEVARSSEVASKTTPNLRRETDTDNSEVFERDFTIYLPGDDELTDEIRERQNVRVRMDALARGLVPVGAVALASEEWVDANNVRLIYQLAVKLNSPKSGVPIGLIAVSEQPSDTPADLPELLAEKQKD